MKSRKGAAKTSSKSPANPPGKQDPLSTCPTEEQIRLRAYELYVERGRADGQDFADWLQAEKELTEIIRKRVSHDGLRAQGAEYRISGVQRYGNWCRQLRSGHL